MTQVAVRYQMTRVATAAGNKAHWSAPDGRYFATKTACGRPVAHVALTAHLKNGVCLACAKVMVRVVEVAHTEALELDEKRTIVRASLSIPTDVELSWDLIEQAYPAYLNGREADVPAELCDHGIKRGRKCSICREDAVDITPKVGQKYRRADGDVIELKAVFPLDRSIAYLIVEAPNHTYRRGLRGTVSFSGLAEDFALVPESST